MARYYDPLLSLADSQFATQAATKLCLGEATASGYWAEYRIWKDEYNHWADRAVASGC